MVGEGVVNLSKKAESVTDRESYIDFRLRLLGEQVWSLTQLLISLNLSEGKNLDLGALHNGFARGDSHFITKNAYLKGVADFDLMLAT